MTEQRRSWTERRPKRTRVRFQMRRCPALSPSARLRFDAPSGEVFLLYPERALVLEGSAILIIQRCSGVRTVAELISELAHDHACLPEEIEPDVLAFLESLDSRGLLTWSG